MRKNHQRLLSETSSTSLSEMLSEIKRQRNDHIIKRIGVPGKLRFLVKVFSALFAFALLAYYFGFIVSRLGEGWGLLWAFIGSGSLALGGVLAYWVGVDLINSRCIRNSIGGDTNFKDGSVICIDGIVHIDNEPLLSPFTRTKCAAYIYSISTRIVDPGTNSTDSRRQEVACGFHMLPTRIEGDHGVIHLRALPEMEPCLRANGTGKWVAECRQFLESILETAKEAPQITREATRIEAQQHHSGDCHCDFITVKGVGDVSAYTMTEETLPCHTEVTVIGTYHKASQSIDGLRARFGPNLMVYQGPKQEVIERLKRENASFNKAVVVMLLVALAVFTYAAVFAPSQVG